MTNMLECIFTQQYLILRGKQRCAVALGHQTMIKQCDFDEK